MARILLLTPQLPYPPQALSGLSQGTTIRNFNLLAGLSARHTIDLVSLCGPESVTEEARRAETLLAERCERLVTVPAPTRTASARVRDTFVSTLPDMALRLESPAMHQAVRGLLAERRYDVVQVEGIEVAQYAGLAGGPTPQAPRIVFDDHNAEYLLQQRACLTDLRRPRRWPAAAYSWAQWQKLARYERRVCLAAGRVAAVSDADRAALLRLAPGLPVAVVPNGVDLEFAQPGVVAPEPGMGAAALVFTGKMDYRPNVDAVLWFAEAVLPLILARAPAAHLFVVGQQPHARLKPLRANPAVTMTGRVPDVRPYIAGAAVYVVPLRIGGGTRLKVLEAMAMAAPMVSTRLGCDGFAFEDGREVVLADEPEPFAAAVIALLADRQAAARLGAAARGYVEANFGWDAIVPLMERLYA